MAGMYTPAAFQVTDKARMHALIRDYPFGVLVCADTGGLQTTHLPFILNTEGSGHGVLLGHMAHANPHWRLFDGRREATVIFTGPHAYISPSWYADPRTVPTWNYAVVHARGRPRIIEDKPRARALLEDLVARHEAVVDPPWTTDQAEPDIDKQLDYIIAFEMDITDLEGKFKFSQNRSRADRQGIVDALIDSDDGLRRAMADAIRKQLQRDD